jgi:hypothetical protein
MKELKCPKCGNVFTVDEADYASIVSQVKNAEFNDEVDRRITEFHKQQEAEQQAREALAGQAHEKELSAKDKVIGEKDGEILRLKEQLVAMGEKRELELGAAVTEKDKEIAALKAAMGQKDQELEIAVMKERQQAKEAAQARTPKSPSSARRRRSLPQRHRSTKRACRPSTRASSRWPSLRPTPACASPRKRWRG